MAHIDNTALDLIWIHLNLEHPRADEALTRFELRAKARLPYASLSVTRNIASTEAVVKIPADQAFVDGLPALVRSSILRVFTEADHDALVPILHGPSWMQPTPE